MILERFQLEAALRQRFEKGIQAECAGIELLAAQLAGVIEATNPALKRHLEACPSCAALLQEHEQWVRIEPESYCPPGDHARVAPPGGLRWRLLRPWALAAALIAAVCTAALVWGPVVFDPDSSGARLLAKGEPDSIAIAVQRDGQRFTARPGDKLREGDQLGFFYSASEPGYLALLALDESGETSLLFPAAGLRGAPIQAGAKISVPDGAIVRAAAGCEWLVGVFSNGPVPIDEIERLLRQVVAKRRRGCQLSLAASWARTIWIFSTR